MEYLQQLWNEILVEDTTLLGDIKDFQFVETKYKEVTSGDKKR